MLYLLIPDSKTMKIMMACFVIDVFYEKSNVFNPIRTGGGGWNPPPPLRFLPFTSANPYLKFLDFSQHLVADTTMKFFFFKNFVSTLSRHFWDTQYKNIVLFFSLIKKNLFTNPTNPYKQKEEK